MENKKTDAMQNAVTVGELEQVSGGAGENYPDLNSLYDVGIHTALDSGKEIRQREAHCSMCQVTIRCYGTLTDLMNELGDHLTKLHSPH